jgi:hypothetical protein
MVRARLTDAERAQRKKERTARSFSDAGYRHYNPAFEGYGSVDEWMRKAEAILTGRGIAQAFDTADTQLQRDLKTLNLEAVPGDAAALKRAYRNTLFTVHPDHGGSDAATIAATQAFERLARHV